MNAFLTAAAAKDIIAGLAQTSRQLLILPMVGHTRAALALAGARIIRTRAGLDVLLFVFAGHLSTSSNLFLSSLRNDILFKKLA